MNETSCPVAPWPCCKEHNPECMACGDDTERLRQHGKRRGPFCKDCYGEIFYGHTPRPQAGQQGMGAKARLRYLQDQ